MWRERLASLFHPFIYLLTYMGSHLFKEARRDHTESKTWVEVGHEYLTKISFYYRKISSTLSKIFFSLIDLLEKFIVLKIKQLKKYYLA